MNLTAKRQKSGKDKEMKRLLISVVLAVALLVVPVSGALAETTAEVSVTAVPSYVTITNAPTSFDFATVVADTDEQTSNGYFTITNGSGVTIDITIQCTTPWYFTVGSNSWTYGAPAENTAQLKASSANGGTGGSQLEGSFDITILSASATLLMDGVTSVTNPTWELQLDAPITFTHGDAQECKITLSAAPE